MKTKIQIKSIGGSLLFEFEKENNTIKDTLIEAIRRGANLRGANLWGADLRGAKNLNPLTSTVLSLLKYQTNKLRAFKYVTDKFRSPQQGNLDYSIGKIVQLKKSECNYSELVECDKGLHVATLEWCLLNRNSDQPVIEVEFSSKDVVSIPYATDGKFRVRKLKVIRIVPEKELTKFKNRKVV